MQGTLNEFGFIGVSKCWEGRGLCARRATATGDVYWKRVWVFCTLCQFHSTWKVLSHEMWDPLSVQGLWSKKKRKLVLMFGENVWHSWRSWFLSVSIWKCTSTWRVCRSLFFLPELYNTLIYILFRWSSDVLMCWWYKKNFVRTAVGFICLIHDETRRKRT